MIRGGMVMVGVWSECSGDGACDGRGDGTSDGRGGVDGASVGSWRSLR